MESLPSIHKVIKVDTNGNWELLIDDPEGTKLAFPTNCAFGGPDMQTLFLANLEGHHFNRVRTSFRGHPLYHQR
jgi:sugar lactone lactonase YvrE